jgi:hypothetical protein
MAKRGRIAAAILLIATIGCSAAYAEAIRLQFRPEVGKKQTMRLISRLATTHPGPAGEDVTEHAWTFIAELEPLAVAPDGSITIKVSLLRAREEASMRSHGEIFHFDTDGGAHELSMGAGVYVAFLGESFTIVVSPQGELVKLDTDAFYTAVVENRIKHEDRAIQIHAEAEYGRRYKNSDAKDRRWLIQTDVEEAIGRLIEKYGSPEKRKQAYREQAADFIFYGTNQLRTLLANLLAPLPPGPVQPGDHWPGPVVLRLEGFMEMAGAYTFKGRAGGVCTLQAEARRNMDDQPLAPPAQEAHRVKLAGTYQATLRVDPATGTLLSKEAVMEMKGTAPMPNARTGTLGAAVPITTKAAVTVEPVPRSPGRNGDSVGEQLRDERFR